MKTMPYKASQQPQCSQDQDRSLQEWEWKGLEYQMLIARDLLTRTFHLPVTAIMAKGPEHVDDTPTEYQENFCKVFGELGELCGDMIKQAATLSYNALSRKLREAHTLVKAMLSEGDKMWEQLGEPLNEEQTQFLIEYRENLHSFQDTWDWVNIVFGHSEFVELHVEEINILDVLQHAIPSTLISLIDQHLPLDLPPIWADRLRLHDALSELFLAVVKDRNKSRILLTGSYNTTWITLKIIGKDEDTDVSQDSPFTEVFSRTLIEMHGGQMLEERGEHKWIFTVMLPICSSPCM